VSRGGSGGWKIDKLAQRAGISVDTIRFYQREGALQPQLLSGDREQLPGIRNALQGMTVSIFEMKARTGHQILDRTRGRHVAGAPSATDRNIEAC
jgi:MerR family regulatory protein